MKNQHLHINGFEHISREKAASLKGGNKEDYEYIVVIIEGKVYRIKINKNGQQVSEPEMI